MELTYQKICLRHNDERKDNKCSLHNITHEEIQEYMFTFLLNEFCSNIFFAGVSFNKTWTEMFIYMYIYLPETLWLIKELFSSSCELTSDLHIFSKFTCKLFMTMY